MTVIQGGTSGVGADVGAVSKGLLGELVDANGRKIAPGECYSAFIDIVPATNFGDGTAYWFMRNTGAKTALIKHIELQLGFSGTAAPTYSSYRFERFATATPTGGAPIVPIKHKNSYSATTISCGFVNTGFTTTGITFESAFWRAGHVNQLAAFDAKLNLSDIGEGFNLELAVGEGMIIRANGTVVVGSRLLGGVYWLER